MLKLILFTIFGVLAVNPALEKAERLYREGKYTQASRKAARAEEEVRDTTELIKALCLQADIAVELGEDSEAIEYYNRCLDLSAFGEPMFMLSSSLYNIASIYYQSGEYDKALEYIVKSINIDSHRGSDSVLALRYLLAAQILYDKGDYYESLKFANKGKKHSVKRNNNNVSGRLIFIETLCREALGGEEPGWTQIEAGYRNALDTLTNRVSGLYYGAVNPYEAEILYHLALAENAQGKDAKPHLEQALKKSRTSQKMRGINPVVEFEACKTLAEIYKKEGNSNSAAYYLAKTDSLSFVPYVKDMSTKLSLSQMEFIRREKDRQIDRQKEKTFYSILIACILAAAFVSLLLLYRRLYRQKKMIEEKNAQLVKLGLQKDKLIAMIQQKAHRAAEKESSDDLDAIVKDEVPLPQIKLSKREMEVIKLCCNGLINKEIADKMNISVRTVESHKLNIFKKIGVNTTGELIIFAAKSGLLVMIKK